ncbi:AzlC family ABC transporter permease [Calorimonas adulescens]|uniref:AzlC family ABC transporter permease n=1 Tax=Calorimonas adulescens TaxID=2606906 RepID=A0A5D8Q9F7_9THEO|nr:AzlC family ABC transporter permease [Calorimonas adulescens]TZE81017.1 AzlC family ABC transporter permease [Calorimonas adulescens]
MLKQMELKRDYGGMRSAIPVVIGYIPIGFAYGVLGAANGLTVMEVVSLSLFVYAGSAQFIAINLLSTGVDIVTIVSTIFIVNLRHLLYSTSLSSYMKKIEHHHIPLLSFFITDETYAVSVTDFQNGRKPDSAYFYQLFLTSYTAWVISSLAGALSERLLMTSGLNWGLDYALPAMYIALLFMQLVGIKKFIVAAFSGALSIALIYLIPGNFNVIIAALSGAFMGVMLEKWI